MESVPKVGAILKKSVDWSDTDAMLPGENVDKAIVSLQIPEVLNDEAIQVILWKKFESAKRLYCFKPRVCKGEAIQVLFRQKIWIAKATVSFQTSEFLKMKRYKYFYAKKIWIDKAIVLLQTQNLLAIKRYNYFNYYFYLKRLYERCISVGGGGGEGIQRFHLALKGQ